MHIHTHTYIYIGMYEVCIDGMTKKKTYKNCIYIHTSEMHNTTYVYIHTHTYTHTHTHIGMYEVCIDGKTKEKYKNYTYIHTY